MLVKLDAGTRHSCRWRGLTSSLLFMVFVVSAADVRLYGSLQNRVQLADGAVEDGRATS